jgi:hypothetical protein
MVYGEFPCCLVDSVGAVVCLVLCTVVRCSIVSQVYVG